MYICYLCNGLEKLQNACPSCDGHMLDGGKAVDYYGDYAPYMESEDAKMIDGNPHSYKEHQCIHVGVCSACNHVEELSISEKEM